ncbi:glycosyltransferase family protein [Hymenobacter psychrotolerans]|uniref:Glycosyltransferase involved in cell wall bisynthesis n=1 Tax=Hymenobacter psychrotolerans DSM 18569 TaxID=1121959 RepID=A0A1M7BGH0_9BACT|nr:glycosyltransferase [Hymenobacter psychrotolerans]SHL54034.1 Glycosyltransferase involved in cell wall bisynthesis [Hymenobacter psychrotolerans DSM 18569]
MPTIRGVRYRLSQVLHKAAERLFVPPGGGSIRDIGQEQLGPDAKRALIVYVLHVIPYYVAGNLEKAPMLNEHSMYWETVEMVRQLNERGYVVDFYDVHCAEPIEWDKYEVAFVQNDRLAECPSSVKIKKVFYCTENYWAFQNLAEMTRLRDFHQRTGIWVRPERQTRISFSDEHADIITSFGTPFQRQFYYTGAERHQLDISVAQQPAHSPKEVAGARYNFVWLGSGGAILKGLDVAVEAFRGLPEATLYIAGNIKREERLWQWLEPLLQQHPNLRYLGWVDVTSASFAKVANNCIGQIYPSASEGGPGSVAQLLHFGLIPIVTETAAVRSASLGFEITAQDSATIITDIQHYVRALMQQSDDELLSRSDACRQFALQHHTRPAYAASFAALLDRLEL